MKKYVFIDKIIKYRFVIAIILFIGIVSFKLHGSSIGVWDEYVKEKINTTEQSLLLGKNRPIRSDEWLVQSTYYFAQAMSDEFYPLNNKNITESGQNMILSYNSPVYDITILAKPFNWGFLILGKEYGLSWYWAFKMIALILLSFELSMILTKKNKILSLIGSFWIAYSPAIQWWFMQHVGDIVFFSIAMIVSFYKYFEHHNSVTYRILNSIIFALSAVGFALVIYPALQVPFAYLVIVFMTIIFLNFLKEKRLNKIDYILIFSILVIIATFLGHFILESYEEIKLSLNTIYPGKRLSLGGEGRMRDFTNFILNIITPFKDIDGMNIYDVNNCEVSSFINFFIGSAIVLIVAIRKKKADKIGIALFITAICQLTWSFVEFPEWIARLTLLSYVPSKRMMLAFSFTAMLFSIWAIGLLFREKLVSVGKGLMISGINLTFYCVIIFITDYRNYISLEKYIFILFIYLIINIAIFCRCKNMFYVFISIAIIMSGVTVNPVSKGIGAIYNKTLSKAIIEISKSDPEGVWLAEGDDVRGNYIYANGAKTFNGTQFYPDMKKWNKIDKNGDNEFYYNRYAHVRVNLTNEENSYNLDNLDAITINMNLNELDKFNIRYIVTKKNMILDFSDTKYDFEELYNSKVDNIKIYKVIY